MVDELQAAIAILEQGKSNVYYTNWSLHTYQFPESSLPRRSRSTEIGPHVDTINEHGYQYGLSNQDIQRILLVVAKKNELDQTASTTLVKNLFPNERINPGIVLTALGGLGQGAQKPNLATQSSLLRWLCNVQQVLQEPESLLRFYALLFNLLDILALRYIIKSIVVQSS